MKAIRKLLNKQTHEDIIIEWADIMVDHSSVDGVIDYSYYFSPTSSIKSTDPSWKFRNAVLSKVHVQPMNAIEDLYINYSRYIKNHLFDNGYIERQSIYAFWQLTVKGKLMKELKGHDNYVRYRTREINILRNQNRINWLLGISAFLAAVMPFMVVLNFPPKVIVNVPAQNQSHSHNDSEYIRQLVSDDLQNIKSNQLHKEPTKKDSLKKVTQ